MAREKTEKELRKVSLVAFGMFAVMSSFFFWKGKLVGASIFGVLFLALGVLPLLFKRPGYAVLRKWLLFTGLIGELINRVMLAAVYFLIILPTGLMMRAAGKDRLMMKKPKGASSYWKNLPAAPSDPEALKEAYSRQF